MDKNRATFGNETVFRPDGSAVSLNECWREHPAVLVFIRHFG